MAAARGELAGAQAALDGLLPQLRRQLGQPRLEYTKVINQGDHMVELPVDFRGVPKARASPRVIRHPVLSGRAAC